MEKLKFVSGCGVLGAMKSKNKPPPPPPSLSVADVSAASLPNRLLKLLCPPPTSLKIDEKPLSPELLAFDDGVLSSGGPISVEKKLSLVELGVSVPVINGREAIGLGRCGVRP